MVLPLKVATRQLRGDLASAAGQRKISLQVEFSLIQNLHTSHQTTKNSGSYLNKNSSLFIQLYMNSANIEWMNGFICNCKLPKSLWSYKEYRYGVWQFFNLKGGILLSNSFIRWQTPLKSSSPVFLIRAKSQYKKPLEFHGRDTTLFQK